LLIASRILQIERGNTRTHPEENSLWKRLWTCSKTEHRVNDEFQLRASIFNGFSVSMGIVSCHLRFSLEHFHWKCGRMGGSCFQY